MDNNNNNSSDEALAVVTECINKLIQHYKQSVHFVNDELPYFYNQTDCTIEKSDAIPPILNHLLATLTAVNSISLELVLENLITAYSSHIHPILVNNHGHIIKSGISCLTHYEILLSTFIAENNEVNLTKTSTETINDTLQTIACDITLLSTPILENESSVSACVVSNIVLATLIRITTKVIMLSGLDLNYDVVRRCCVSILAFGSSEMNPLNVYPDANKRLDTLSQYTSELLPELNVICDTSFHWTNCSVKGDYWNIASDGVVSQCAGNFWSSLTRTLNVPGSENSKKAAIEALDLTKMATAVRAHFFGHDMPQNTTSSTNVKHLHLGSTKPLILDSEKRKSYDEIPSRIHVALHFISLIENIRDGILEQLLPILYELLTASNNTLWALSASAICRLCHCNCNLQIWADNSTHLLQLLDQDIKICRDGPIFAMLGLAQYSLFLNLDSNITLQARRLTLQQNLSILERNSLTTSGSLLLEGILRGSVLPLLSTFLTNSSYECMEVGRIGLAAVLPLLRLEPLSYSKDLQLSALVALLLLLFAAYPIIHRHGGKILSCCLVCATSDDAEISLLSTRVGAIAAFLCGENSQKILSLVTSSQQQYKDSLRQAALQIQSNLDRMPLKIERLNQ